jgi:hypothetical protein
MAVVVVEVVRGKDGKTYPAAHAPGHGRPLASNPHAAGYVHALRHRGLSFDKIVKALPSYGIRASYGSVWTLFHANVCEQCVPEIAPPPRPRARPVPWH